MYGWIWQRLPGKLGGKATWVVLLGIAMIALLWFLVFPWATIHLPIDQVGVGG
jgi:hypothetical protein